MKKTTVYIDEEILIELKLIAQRESRSEAAVIREGLAAYVADRKPKLPSFVGIVTSGPMLPENEEEWLAENWKPDW